MTSSTTSLFVCEKPGVYRMATRDEVRGTALSILSGDITGKPMLNSPNAVKDYLRLQIGDLPHEVFSVVFLDAQNRFLAYEQMFRGSLTQTAVYPREVIKRALEMNADSVVLVHNHPSGSVEPSQADRKLTQSLKNALAMVDVSVRDHIIVARGAALSMAEEGLI